MNRIKKAGCALAAALMAAIALTACGAGEGGTGEAAKDGKTYAYYVYPENEGSKIGSVAYGKLSTEGKWFGVNGMSGRAEYEFDSGMNVTDIKLYIGSGDSIYHQMVSSYADEQQNALLVQRDTYNGEGGKIFGLTATHTTMENEEQTPIYESLKGVKFLFADEERSSSKYSAEFSWTGDSRIKTWRDGSNFDGESVWVLFYHEDGTLSFANVYNMVGSRIQHYVFNYEKDKIAGVYQFEDGVIYSVLDAALDEQGHIVRLSNPKEEQGNRHVVQSIEITYTEDGSLASVTDTRTNEDVYIYEYVYTDGRITESTFVDERGEDYHFAVDEDGIAQPVYNWSGN